MAIKIQMNSEDAIQAALVKFDEHSSSAQHVLDVVQRGLAGSERLEALWHDLHALVAAEVQRTMARQVVVDLVV